MAALGKRHELLTDDDLLEIITDLELEPRGFALSGGEDFELLFSIAPEKVADLKQTGLNCYPVGEIFPASDGIVLATPDGGRTPLPGGYAHFT